MKRLAICVGLTRVDPAAYDGWDGRCPGCDLDAARFAALCGDAGFDGVTLLLNAAATASAISEVFLDMARSLGPDDLLVFYNSGHGGQIPDLNGDEGDGLDETLCWHDTEFCDDRFSRLLAAVPHAARVFHVTDTCNAGTNFRARRRRSTPLTLGQKAVCRFRGAGLLHFGGASDGRHSYGDDDGGEFTNALLDAVARARKPLSYHEWFARAQSRMPRTQRPILSSHGRRFSDRVKLT